MAVSNLLKGVLHWTGYGEEGTLTWFFSGSQAQHSNAALTSAATAAVNKAKTSTTPSSWTKMLAYFGTGQSIESFKLYEYDADNAPATGLGVATNAASTGTGTCQHPLQTSLVCSLRTDTPGPSYRGRQYWPAHTRSIISGNDTHALATQVTNLAFDCTTLGLDLRDGIQSNLSISSLGWVVYSRTKRVVTPIQSVEVNNVFDTQRRREASVSPSQVVNNSVGTNPT
jgi:hypothetical protein